MIFSKTVMLLAICGYNIAHAACFESFSTS